MDDRTVEQMREARRRGDRVVDIAARYGVSTSTVHRWTVGDTSSTNKGGPRSSNAEETASMWRLWVSGVSQQAIADMHGITQSAVSQRLDRFCKSLDQAPLETVFQRELAVLDELRRRLMSMAVDVQLNPSDRISAMREIRAGTERLAKMLGFDAAAAVDVGGTVRYEIAGLPADVHR